MSSMCAANSSIVPGGRSAPSSLARALTTSRQRLGILHPCDVPERFDETAPVVSLCRQHPAAGCRDAVMTPAPLSGFLDPAAANRLALFEPVQRCGQRREREGKGAGGSLADLARDLVAVQVFVFDERQNQDLGAPPFRVGQRTGIGHHTLALGPYI